MRFFKKEADNYTLYGALLGLLFPLIATGLRCYLNNHAVSFRLYFSTFATVDPLLWIIDTAPFFLGLFSRFGGIRQDRLNEDAACLQQLLDERTTLLQESEKNHEQMKIANAKLSDSMHQLQVTQEKLMQTEKMAVVGNLIVGLAHEVNTPLGACITAVSFQQNQTYEFTQILENGALRKSTLHDYLQSINDTTATILTNCERIATLIETFRQISSDYTYGKKTMINVHDFLTCASALIMKSSPDKKHTISIQCSDTIEVTMWHNALLHIVNEIMKNAYTHAFQQQESGVITITATLRESTLSIIFADNGRGMSEEERKNVFFPFYTTARSMGNPGLGMYIVYNIVVQALSGTIICNSEPGKGTIFIVTIPIVL
ncbi:MAG: HAMP domain-containing histidine kinase [Chitinivibrionales bacterium]|nr:HAMP domain-containing histidine kinase [Chitinivibrionales bacterium]